jgi:L-threonylcarbamoyladenylate synthase
LTKVSQTELIAFAIAGKIISFPTDTVPALAVLPEYSELIFALKERPRHKPLILMGASFEDLCPYLSGTSKEMEIWQQVTRKYWPGDLTLVLPSSSLVPAAMHQGDPTTIGIRVPNCDLAQTILSSTGPLATTSANLSGEAPLETISAIEAAFPQIFTLNLLETKGKFGSGLPSTVAKWTSRGWEILREGRVKEI